MVRILAIVLLVLLALRLIGRLIAALMLRSRPAARPSVEKQKKLLLAQCSRCGTYFDPGSTLAVEGPGSEAFCSVECRRAAGTQGSEE